MCCLSSNSPFNLVSKHIRKQLRMISQTLSFDKKLPSGLNIRVLSTCTIFSRTTPSELLSPPTNRACVTASAMF